MAGLWHIGYGFATGAETDDYFTTAETPRELVDAIRPKLDESVDSEIDSRDAHRKQAREYREAENVEGELEAWREADAANLRIEELGNLYDNLNNERADHSPLYRTAPDKWRETVEQIINDRFPAQVSENTYLYIWLCGVEECDHCKAYRADYEDEEDES